MSGKNGGNVLDPHRSHAFFRLLNDPDARKNVTLVSTVLYGSENNQRWSDEMLEIEATAKGLPSPAELALCYDLDKAKQLCKDKKAKPTNVAEKPTQRRGRSDSLR